MQLANFASACDQHSPVLASFLSDFLDELSDDEDVGAEPYQVPRRLIDPKFVAGCFPAFYYFLTGFFQDWRPVALPCPPRQHSKSSHICQRRIKRLF